MELFNPTSCRIFIPKRVHVQSYVYYYFLAFYFANQKQLPQWLSGRPFTLHAGDQVHFPVSVFNASIIFSSKQSCMYINSCMFIIH